MHSKSRNGNIHVSLHYNTQTYFKNYVLKNFMGYCGIKVSEMSMSPLTKATFSLNIKQIKITSNHNFFLLI